MGAHCMVPQARHRNLRGSHMGLAPDASFYARPQEETCQVAGAGCTGTPQVRISCQVEGRSLLSCSVCYRGWRNKLRGSPVLSVRCPACVSWKPAGVIPGLDYGNMKIVQDLLTGPVAEAVDKA